VVVITSRRLGHRVNSVVTIDSSSFETIEGPVLRQVAQTKVLEGTELPTELLTEILVLHGLGGMALAFALPLPDLLDTLLCTLLCTRLDTLHAATCG
jgi:hypothetical protein